MSPSNTPEEAAKPSYQEVRAGFILQGITLGEWCRCNGIHIQNVRAAFLGGWNGTKAEELRQRVAKAAGVAR
jgi:hypothetical protein